MTNSSVKGNTAENKTTTMLKTELAGNRDNLFQIFLVACVATIGGFLFGFDSGVINGTVDGLKFAFHSDSIGTGFNVASMLLGCAIGAFGAGLSADSFGRKSVLLVSAVLFIVSAWGSGIATSSMEFVVYRLIGGLAVGGASVLAPAYISEIAPVRFRGMLSSIQQMAIIAGLFCSFLSNYLLVEVSGNSIEPLWLGFETWRWMFWIELLPALLFFACLLLIPESPRYLAITNQHTKGMNVLVRLFGKNKASAIWQDIRTSIDNNSAIKITDVFNPNSSKLKAVIWIGIGLAVLQQLAGVNVVFYYGAVLWQAVGFSESDALLINIISGAISIVACFIALMLIDKIGRKPLLLIGSVGMTFSLFGIATAFANGTIGADGQLDLGSWSFTALLQVHLYVFFFNFSWGPIMWVMLGEMFPNKIRGSGLAIAGLAQWLANFFITMTFPLLLTGIGLATTFSFYTLFAFSSILFVLWFVVETKGKKLEQMT
ncbi:sugar porter family MFS transporter [Psychrosphaera sp. B3R10]|uniref:sugar porter family MFS transporter n=2 Tax=unclassified Psychrosphaera TaxID=2641570 RepID=UPI001C089C29|nr:MULTISPECIES: sugar porter family MFS transporter [unclassified Psychrosphaera]MBU2883208.1 sugar porter family MFS transporter [Psychrosphaera sp. I2R16]MBU2988664.1 sugar porter family MFS transporter [Psychrosphaera sp. B3R10]